MTLPDRWQFSPSTPPRYVVYPTVAGENELFTDEPRLPLVELTPTGSPPGAGGDPAPTPESSEQS